MRVARRPVCALVVALAPCGAFAAPVTHTVDFDHAPSGAVIASSAIIDALYAPWHVSFGASNTDGSLCTGCHAYASNLCVVLSPVSPPNVGTLFGNTSCPDLSEFYTGAVRATFDVPCSSVSVVIVPINVATSRGVLRAYNGAGVLVGEALSGTGAHETLTVTAADIRRADFSGAGPQFVWCDDFSFTYDTSAVEPVTWSAIKALFR